MSDTATRPLDEVARTWFGPLVDVATWRAVTTRPAEAPDKGRANNRGGVSRLVNTRICPAFGALLA